MSGQPVNGASKQTNKKCLDSSMPTSSVVTGVFRLANQAWQIKKLGNNQEILRKILNIGSTGRFNVTTRPFFQAPLPPTSVTGEIRQTEQLHEAKVMLAGSFRREYSVQRT
jgi:hypothetical protein